MDINVIRLIGHYELLGLIVAIGIVSYIARRTVLAISMKYWYLVVMAVILYSLWVLGLALSVGTNALFPRHTIVPLLAGLEFTAGIIGWTWFFLTWKLSFRIVFSVRRDLNQGIL